MSDGLGGFCSGVRVVVLVASGLLCVPALGGLGPASEFTEDFEGGPANWQSGLFQPVGFEASGSFDGSAFVTASRDLTEDAGTGVTVFRAQDNVDASGDGFVGNYLAGGIKELSFRVRHDAPVALDGLVRFATLQNFPGVFFFFDEVEPDTWTEVTIDIDIANPAFGAEGAPTLFFDVFEAVSNIQFVFTQAESGPGAGLTNFAIDEVSIAIPGPGVVAMVGIAGVGLARRRRG